VKDYKGVIIATSIAITGSVLMVSLIGKAKGHVEIQPEIELMPTFEPGKQLDMYFIDKSTGEIVGWGECREGYMDEIIDIMSDEY